MALAKNTVFISYRKDDAGGWAVILAERLRAILGQEAVFLDDSTGIPPGTAWPDRIEVALSQCRIFLPIIAPTWNGVRNLARIKEPEDWVRRELFKAHERRRSVSRIPIFVNEADTIDSNLLGDDPVLQAVVADLLFQQGYKLDRSPELWGDKVDALVDRIEEETGVVIPRPSSSSATEYEPSVSSSGHVVIAGKTGIRIDVTNVATVHPGDDSAKETGTDHNGRVFTVSQSLDNDMKESGLHSFLNSRQGLLTLMGLVIAGLAFWYQIVGKTGTGSIDGPLPTITIPEIAGDVHVDASTTINERDPLVAKTVDFLVQQLETKDGQLANKDQQIVELTKAVEALAESQGAPNAPVGIDEALESLEKGETQKAEAIFQAIANEKEAESEDSATTAAEAYRHLGALAILDDTDKALRAYQRSVELDPNSAAGWNQVGLLLMNRSDGIDDAIGAFSEVMRLGKETESEVLLIVAYGNLSLAYRKAGDENKSKEFLLKRSNAYQRFLKDITETDRYKNYPFPNSSNGQQPSLEDI